MRTMWMACVLAACVTGCGDDTKTTGKSAKTGEPAATKAEPAPAQDDRWRVVMTFELDFDHARQNGLLPENDSDEVVLGRVLQITRGRLRAMDLGEHGLVVRGGRRFEVGFAELAAADRAGVIDLITRAGTLEFFIEVLPDEQYAQSANELRERAPARKGVWPGNTAEFHAFKKNEVAVWRQAHAAKKPYTPTRPGFRLVREASKDGGSPDHFHVLEVPTPDQTFDGRMVRSAAVSENPETRRPMVVYDIGSAWQNAFGAWTEANLHLPMAIVLDGEYRSAPVIQARLSRSVQITLGRGSREDVAREARVLATVLQTGSLDLSPKLVSVVER